MFPLFVFVRFLLELKEDYVQGKEIRETTDDPDCDENRAEDLETLECSASSDNLKDLESRNDEDTEATVFIKSSEVACDSTEEAFDADEASEFEEKEGMLNSS